MIAFGINHIELALVPIVCFLFGYLFDKENQQKRISYESEKHRKRAKLYSWLWHDIMMVASAAFFILFQLANLHLPIITPLGVTAWVVGTLVMGWQQKQNNHKRSILDMGDGDGNSLEFMFYVLTVIVRIFIRKASMSQVSAVVRLLLFAASLVLYSRLN